MKSSLYLSFILFFWISFVTPQLLTQQQSFSEEDDDTKDLFGNSVIVLGNFLVVGALILIISKIFNKEQHMSSFKVDQLGIFNKT